MVLLLDVDFLLTGFGCVVGFFIQVHSTDAYFLAIAFAVPRLDFFGVKLPNICLFTLVGARLMHRIATVYGNR